MNMDDLVLNDLFVNGRPCIGDVTSGLLRGATVLIAPDPSERKQVWSARFVRDARDVEVWLFWEDSAGLRRDVAALGVNWIPIGRIAAIRAIHFDDAVEEWTLPGVPVVSAGLAFRAG